MDSPYGADSDIAPRGPWSRDRRRGRTQDRELNSEGGLGQRLDRWMLAGRQIVEGVAGTRPGSSPSGASTGPRGVRRPRLEGLGRWMEDRIDWLLEDEDDWPEPWQDPSRRSPSADQSPAASAVPRSRSTAGTLASSPLRTLVRSEPPPPEASSNPSRRPLEAISRRGRAGADSRPTLRSSRRSSPGPSDAPDGTTSKTMSGTPDLSCRSGISSSAAADRPPESPPARGSGPAPGGEGAYPRMLPRSTRRRS